MLCQMIPCTTSLPKNHPTGYCSPCLTGVITRREELHKEVISSGRDPYAHSPALTGKGKRTKHRKREKVLEPQRNLEWKAIRLHRIHTRRGA